MCSFDIILIIFSLEKLANLGKNVVYICLLLVQKCPFKFRPLVIRYIAYVVNGRQNSISYNDRIFYVYFHNYDLFINLSLGCTVATK